MLADRSAGILTVLVMIVAPAIPIQSLFPNQPLTAAFAVGWMPLAFGLLLSLPAIDDLASAHMLGFVLIEGLVDWIAVVVGVWAISRIRGKTAEQP